MTPETARKMPRNGTCTGSIAAQFREAMRLPVEKAGDNAILPECFPHLFNMESCLYSGIFTGFPPFPPLYYYDYYSNKPYALGVRARLRLHKRLFQLRSRRRMDERRLGNGYGEKTCHGYMQDTLQNQPYRTGQGYAQCAAHNAARNELRRNEMRIWPSPTAFGAQI